MRRTTRLAEGDRRGVAAIEFAVAMPVVLIMTFTIADAVQLGRGHLRAQSAAMQIGQIVSQCEQFHTNDEAVLKELAQRILGSTAANNARFALRITAFGRDSGNNNINWTVSQNAGTGRPGEPALAIDSKGSQLPTGDPVPPSTARKPYEMGKNRLLFRTEVFASVDRTTLTRSVSLLASGSSAVPLRYETARGEAVHATRLPNTDSLKTKKTGSEKGCLT